MSAVRVAAMLPISDSLLEDMAIEPGVDMYLSHLLLASVTQAIFGESWGNELERLEHGAPVPWDFPIYDDEDDE